MLKKSALKKITTSTLALFIMLLLCIFPNKNDDDISLNNIIYVDNDNDTAIYVLDQNSYVARTYIKQNDEDFVPYIIEVLTKNSLKSNLLNVGFNATISQNTKLLDYNLNNNILTLNFSKEFLNMENENATIESLIYSLCENNNIKKIQIQVEGQNLNELPSGKKLPSYLDKSYGINKKYDLTDIKGSSKVTIYYMNKYNDHLYYIPITKISNNTYEPVEIIVNELKSAPIYETNFISYLNASYELKDYEILENSITLSFDNKLLAGLNDDEIIENVKYTLALSLRDTYDINDILININ